MTEKRRRVICTETDCKLSNMAVEQEVMPFEGKTMLSRPKKIKKRGRKKGKRRYKKVIKGAGKRGRPSKSKKRLIGAGAKKCSKKKRRYKR